MPTVSADRLTYTFHIKSGVMWNTKPPRQVTSEDFKRGIERNCDPTLAPDGNPGYYTATIAGFAAFCTPFENMVSSSPSSRASYINGHDVSGIETPDNQTIVFMLTEPAVDFLNILAFPLASAAPIEDLSYVPVTKGDPIYSDGPYQISNYDVTQDPAIMAFQSHEIDLDHNPAWSQITDTIRHDYVSEIQIRLDVPWDLRAGGGSGRHRQRSGRPGVGQRGPTQKVPGLTSPVWNAQFGVFPLAGQTVPIVRFNVLSPNNGGALGNPKVRQALE